MSDFHASIPELNSFVSRYQGADKIVLEELTNAGNKAGFLVERLAKARAKVWRGTLRRSITTKTTSQGLFVTTKVGTNVVYARARNYGRPAGAPMPPPGALLEWMQSKGIATAREFLIARAVQRNTTGDHFLTGAFDESKSQIQAIYRDVPRHIIARLTGGH